MDQRAPLRVVRAVLVTTVVLALACAGHLAGAGTLPPLVVLVGLGLCVLVPVAWAAGRCLTLGRLLMLLGAAQLGLHRAFTVLSAAPTCGPVTGHHGRHGPHPGLISVCPGEPRLDTDQHLPIVHGPAMLAGHLLAVLATAVVLARLDASLELAWAWLRPLLAPAHPARLTCESPRPLVPQDGRPMLVWRGLCRDRVRGPPIAGRSGRSTGCDARRPCSAPPRGLRHPTRAAANTAASQKDTHPMTIHTPSRLTTGVCAAAAAAGLMTLGLSPAAAHVTADATSTAAGGYTRITFSVPNESETASTTELELTLPEDAPFASVRTQPVEGWDAEITEQELATPATVGEGAITEAASTITWTADAEHRIGPGEFQTFTISVGPLPGEEGRQIVLPVSQTYTDGRTVAWDQPTTEGGVEPERPAPSLTITTAEAEAHGHGTAGQATTAAEQTEQSAARTTGSSALAWAGLLAGLLGLAAGATALLRTRRRG